MSAFREKTTREKRLHVRLTAEEAAYIGDAAQTRGLTVADYAREALLRRSGFFVRVRRRTLSSEIVDAGEQLRVAMVGLRRLADALRASGAVIPPELEACLAEARTALAVMVR